MMKQKPIALASAYNNARDSLNRNKLPHGFSSTGSTDSGGGGKPGGKSFGSKGRGPGSAGSGKSGSKGKWKSRTGPPPSGGKGPPFSGSRPPSTFAGPQASRPPNVEGFRLRQASPLVSSRAFPDRGAPHHATLLTDLSHGRFY